MKRTLFSLILLLILSTAFISCSVVGGRISHALGGEEDYIMNEESFEKGIENIDIDWKSGDVSVKAWDGDQIIVREKSATSLTSRTKMKAKAQEGKLTVNFASKGVWMLPLLFKKDLEVLIPSSWDMKNITINTASSPVRILRNEAFQTAIHGVYPCGEGAGYAGGITSAAVDGIKVAEAVCREILK